MASSDTVRAPLQTVAWLAWLIGVGLLIYGVSSTAQGSWAVLQLILGGIAFGVVGLILATRAAHLVGWLFLALQASFGISLLEVSGPELVLVAAILLVFPTGRLPSRRWRVAVVALAIAALGVVVDVLVGINENYLWLLFLGCVVPVMIGSAVRIVLDYRRSIGDIRQQLKWLAWILIVGGGVLLFSAVPIPYLDDAHDLAGLILLVGSPIAVGFAVSRYRLYEIDRIISQTVSYAIIVVVLGLIFALVAVWIPNALGMQDPLAIAAATLAVAAGFNPLRRRVQEAVDRRFNRSKYDHERVAQEFAASLRHGVDLDQVVHGWVGVVSATMRPSSIGIWTRS